MGEDRRHRALKDLVARLPPDARLRAIHILLTSLTRMSSEAQTAEARTEMDRLVSLVFRQAVSRVVEMLTDLDADLDVVLENNNGRGGPPSPPPPPPSAGAAA